MLYFYGLQLLHFPSLPVCNYCTFLVPKKYCMRKTQVRARIEHKTMVCCMSVGDMLLYVHQTKLTCTSIEEYSAFLHASARRSLEDMLASEQECLGFRRKHLFNSDNSRVLNASLLSVLTRYLTAVRKHLQTSSLPNSGWYCEQ